jgi:hypothetical protein
MPLWRLRFRFRPPASAPVELRFIDLFMIVVAALLFVIVTVGLAGALAPQPAPAKRLQIATDSLPVAVEGARYTLHLAARGGTAPYRWRLVQGDLPRGLSLHAATGLIAGTPVRPVLRTLRVEATDARGAAARRALTLEVRARRPGEPLRTEGETLLLPEAVTFVPYRFRFAPTGGRPPCTWRLLEGTLPPGLQLSPDGTVSGTLELMSADARLAEPWRFSLEVEDSVGARRSQLAALPVRFAPRWSWMKTVEEAVGAAFWGILQWVVAPLLIATLSGLLLLALAGCRGGRSGPWEGLLLFSTRLKVK